MEEQVYVCLFFLAHGGSYRSAAQSVNYSVSTVQRCVVGVTSAIRQELGSNIVFSRTQDELVSSHSCRAVTGNSLLMDVG